LGDAAAGSEEAGPSTENTAGAAGPDAPLSLSQDLFFSDDLDVLELEAVRFIYLIFI
jgi:hypothetical protein